MPNLKELWLGDNQIGGDGVAALASAPGRALPRARGSTRQQPDRRRRGRRARLGAPGQRAPACTRIFLVGNPGSGAREGGTGVARARGGTGAAPGREGSGRRAVLIFSVSVRWRMPACLACARVERVRVRVTFEMRQPPCSRSLTLHLLCSLHIPLLANTARTRFSGAAQAARGGDGPAAARASAPLLSGRGGRVPRRVPVPDQPALPHSPGAAHDHLAAARAARRRPAAVVRASAQTGAPALRSSARGPRVPAACTLPVPEARGTLYVRTAEPEAPSWESVSQGGPLGVVH